MDATEQHDTIAKVQLMAHDAGVSDSLSRTIAEFRDEVLGWIDTTLVRLRKGEQEQNIAREEKPVPAGLTRVRIELGSPLKSAEPGPKASSDPPDSVKRLDALARLLDQRLKVAEESASSSSGTSGEAGHSNT